MSVRSAPKLLHFSLVHLRSFVLVAELSSVTRAALASGYTQSAISLHLKALEKALGAVLFDRDRAGMPLTSIGQQVVGDVRALVTAVEQLEARVRTLTGAVVAPGRRGPDIPRPAGPGTRPDATGSRVAVSVPVARQDRAEETVA